MILWSDHVNEKIQHAALSYCRPASGDNFRRDTEHDKRRLQERDKCGLGLIQYKSGLGFILDAIQNMPEIICGAS